MPHIGCTLGRSSLLSRTSYPPGTYLAHPEFAPLTITGGGDRKSQRRQCSPVKKDPHMYYSLLFALVQVEERRLVLPSHADALDATDLRHERRATFAELVGVPAAREELREEERAGAR